MSDAPDQGDTPDNPYPVGHLRNPAPINNPTTNTPADHDDPPDTTAELARWKQIARKHEDRAKANAEAAKELAQVKAASMTDLERAKAEAKAEARTEVLREVGAARAADHVRLAAVGRSLNVEALLRVMDLSQFVDDEGQPDTKKIQAWVDEASPAQDDPEPRVPRVPTGPRGPNNIPLNGDPLLRDLKSKLGIP